MIKVGLVGTGYWGPNLARVLSQYPGCDFSAACDLRPEHLEGITAQYPSVKGYLDFGEVLQSGLDAVVTTTATTIASNATTVIAALVAMCLLDFRLGAQP